MTRSTSILAVLAVLVWLGLPSAVAADNCQNLGANERDRECSIPEKVIGFFTGMGLMAAAAFRRQKARSKHRMWEIRQGKRGLKKPFSNSEYTARPDPDADPNEPEPPDPDAPATDGAPPDGTPPPEPKPKPPGVHGPPA